MGCANIRFLGQLLWMPRTIPGRQILDKVSGSTYSQAAGHLADLKKELVCFNRFHISPWSHSSPCQSSRVPCLDCIPEIPQKSSAADCALHTYTKAYLESEYPVHLRAYTYGYVSAMQSMIGNRCSHHPEAPVWLVWWAHKLSLISYT